MPFLANKVVEHHQPSVDPPEKTVTVELLALAPTSKPPLPIITITKAWPQP